ncbi:unnamed protein product [marine sediment metagenome]|uniref:Uncharacterized protein n=1 Tax=marine sediment metagenome TaxID=412755 RepID=X0T0B5_9ZZZZ
MPKKKDGKLDIQTEVFDLFKIIANPIKRETKCLIDSKVPRKPRKRKR